MAGTQEDSPRGFGHFLAGLDDEQAHARASRELHELTKVLRDEAVARHGQVKGSISLTIELRCDERGTVEALYEIKTKEPRPRVSKSIYWLDKKGHLSVENPAQQVLPLREVSAQGRALREIDGDVAAMKEV